MTKSVGSRMKTILSASEPVFWFTGKKEGGENKDKEKGDSLLNSGGQLLCLAMYA